MSNGSILVDAVCDGLSRIVVLDNNGLIENLVLENAGGHSIKGNMYLAKIKRVEYSLRATFVDFGGDKNGFLSYSDIHTDYFQIPAAEREALVNRSKVGTVNDIGMAVDVDSNTFSHTKIRHNYNIQEVIKSGQNVLVQVAKDGRGNKGASLTTYVSIPGRYCILMPNTPGGVSVSRKISSRDEQHRLTSIIEAMNVPQGASVVIRTAGLNVSEESIVADYGTLMNKWNTIRQKTLSSKVGDMVYCEANTYEKTIRDIYREDMKCVVVNDKKTHDELSEAFKKVIPLHKPKLKLYSGKKPLFVSYNVEKKLDELLSDRVDLPSGGYIVIQQTEALISIDVNSGRATGEKSIEHTARMTNLEAVAEIARQLNLRNLGGLIVIDFIDMESAEHRSIVYDKMREVFAKDRAKIQFTRISMFGLVEISRQRVGPGFFDSMSALCPACKGVGRVRLESITSDRLLQFVGSMKNCSYNVLLIICSPTIFAYLTDHGKEYIDKMKEISSKEIIAVADNAFYPGSFVVKGFDKPEDVNDPKKGKQLYSFFEKSVRHNVYGSQNEIKYVSQNKFLDSSKKLIDYLRIGFSYLIYGRV